MGGRESCEWNGTASGATAGTAVPSIGAPSFGSDQAASRTLE
jgi:hypothetical protein